jgi:hypothetical protein
MEQQNQTPDSSLFGLSIDTPIRSHLSETARWAKFLAILGFIFCGLFVIGGIIFAVSYNSYSSYNSDYGDQRILGSLGPAVAIFYILGALLYFFPCLFLFRFAGKMKTALAANSQQDLTDSFQNLKKLYRFIGILTIIVISLYLILFLIVGASFMGR